eukprot:214673_1
MMTENRKRHRNNNTVANEPPPKKQKVRPEPNKKKTPKNVLKYWNNKQLSGKCAVIRHGSNYQIAKFLQVSKTHALMECLESKSQLSICWKFIYPIIDYKFKYKSLL